MLRFYQVQDRIDGFFHKHFTYEALLELVEQHDIILVDNYPFPDDISHMKSVGFHSDDEKFYIVISDKVVNPNSKWYYLGHELGHYFLHKEEDAFFTVDLDECTITDERSGFLEVMEAEANLFSKFLFLPLETVRGKANLHLFDTNGEMVGDLVNYTLDKLKDPKPKDLVRLNHLVGCILDSYLIFLGIQNVYQAQNGHMEHVMDLVKQVEIFETPIELMKN